MRLSRRGFVNASAVAAVGFGLPQRVMGLAGPIIRMDGLGLFAWPKNRAVLHMLMAEPGKAAALVGVHDAREHRPLLLIEKGFVENPNGSSPVQRADENEETVDYHAWEIRNKEVKIGGSSNQSVSVIDNKRSTKNGMYRYTDPRGTDTWEDISWMPSLNVATGDADLSVAPLYLSADPKLINSVLSARVRLTGGTISSLRPLHGCLSHEIWTVGKMPAQAITDALVYTPDASLPLTFELRSLDKPNNSPETVRLKPNTSPRIKLENFPEVLRGDKDCSPPPSGTLDHFKALYAFTLNASTNPVPVYEKLLSCEAQLFGKPERCTGGTLVY